jgi:hypothetical protein
MQTNKILCFLRRSATTGGLNGPSNALYDLADQ